MAEQTEKIRNLKNEVRLGGFIAELSNIREGVTQNNIPYISFNGVIQCGEEQVYGVRFKTFVKSKKSDGTDSKNFAAVKQWIKTVIPKYKDVNGTTVVSDNPTFVEAIGSIVDHPYVNKENKLVEATEINLQFFRKFTNYKAELDIEGYVGSIINETKAGDSEETTGRQKLQIISRDIFSNILNVKNLIIPEDLVEAFNDGGYEKGITSTFYIEFQPHASLVPVKTGGIGVQRTTEGKPYLEWVVVGADSIIDSDSEKALKPSLIKQACIERQSKLKEIESKGYQGKTETKPDTQNNEYLATSSDFTSVDYTDMDDLPF